MSRSEVSVPIPTTLFLELADFLTRSGSGRDPVDAVAMAIGYWLENAEWKQDDLNPPVHPKDGFWWKTVFIPTGSKLRMAYKGKTYGGVMSAQGILFGDETLSPSEFTFKVTGTARNAWRDIEVQFPGSGSWLLADNLRRNA